MNSSFLVFCCLLASAAFAGRDNSLADFPRLAGETDDAPRFQRAVDACQGGVLSVPGEDYVFAQTVYVTNLCSIVMSPSARITAVAKMEWMIKIDAIWQFSPRTAPKGVNGDVYHLTYRGGTLDANGLASCLAIDNYRHFTLENATFLNGRKYGVGIETTGRGYEMVARNLFIKTLKPGLAGNTGLYSYGGDSHYTDIIVTDCTTGVHFAGRGANRLTRIHVWGGPVKPAKPGELPEMLKNSVCFRIDSSGEILRDCYADTGEIGFWMNGWENRMFGCSYFNNTGFKLTDVTIIRQDRGSLWVGGAMVTRQTPDTRLYVGSPDAQIHWSDDCILRWFYPAQDQSLPAVALPKTMPTNIDSARQLFLDDALLSENKAKRVWHQPSVSSSAMPVPEADDSEHSVFYHPFRRQWCAAVPGKDKKGEAGLVLACDGHLDGLTNSLPHQVFWLKRSDVGSGGAKGELAGISAVAYESLMIGLCRVILPDGKWLYRFGFSRPGDIRKWSFPSVPADGSYLEGARRLSAGLVAESEREIRIPYESSDAGEWRVATLRRDGFCSLADGTATTKPMVFTKGSRLCLNVDSAKGVAAVIAETPDGRRLAECRVEGEDAFCREAFALKPNVPFRLRFALRGGAHLYSFWIDEI